MKIFVNAGHDRKLDSGAVGYNLREADVTYAISEMLTAKLRSEGHTVKLIQDDSLGYICDEANKFGADIFVAVHCNSFNGSARGSETYHYLGSYRGNLLARKVQSEIVRQVSTADRGVKTANFYVLKNTIAPAILVETAFIDNYYDNQILLNDKEKFASAIAQGVRSYSYEN